MPLAFDNTANLYSFFKEFKEICDITLPEWKKELIRKTESYT